MAPVKSGQKEDVELLNSLFGSIISSSTESRSNQVSSSPSSLKQPVPESPFKQTRGECLHLYCLAELCPIVVMTAADLVR